MAKKRGLTDEEKAKLRQRFGIEHAIDCELRACASRVIALNGNANESTFTTRAVLAFRDAAELLRKMGCMP